MRVFHFGKKDDMLCNIKNSRIKIATINKLNDPFEFYFNLTRFGKPLDEIYLNNLKDHYDRILGFLCFSKQMKNPVLWAHYTDNHKGICLEFEIDKKYLLKIEYIETPINIETSEPNWRDKFGENSKYKYNHWLYEEEWRMIVPLTYENIIREGDLFFSPWDKYLSLKSVYTGIRCDLDEEDMALLKDNKIKLYKTKQSQNSFSLELIT